MEPNSNQINETNQTDQIVPKKSFDFKKLGSTIFLIIVVIFLVVYFSYNLKEKEVTITPQVEKTLTDGSLVEGFPKELILTKDAKIVSSKLLTGDLLDRTMDTMSANFITKTVFQDVFRKYIEYLQRNEYLITETGTSPSQIVIYAVKKENSLSIFINKGEKETNVGLFSTINVNK